MFEPTHLTGRPVPLWYGEGATVIASGTPINVIRSDEHLVWFTYQGIDSTHACADVDAIGITL